MDRPKDYLQRSDKDRLLPADQVGEDGVWLRPPAEFIPTPKQGDPVSTHRLNIFQRAWRMLVGYFK